MSLKDYLDTNARFVARTPPEKLPDQPRKHCVVVTCMDYRLTHFLEDALGILRADAFMVRNAGNTQTPLDSSVMRSIVAASLNFEISEVLVIGHTKCAMKIDAMTAADRMRARGIPREALGTHDLREWLGLIGDERENVRRMVNEIASSPLVPKTTMIHGFIMDTDTGAISHVDSREPGVEPPKRTPTDVMRPAAPPMPPPPPAFHPSKDPPRAAVPPPVHRDPRDRQPPTFKPREGERLGW